MEVALDDAVHVVRDDVSNVSLHVVVDDALGDELHVIVG